MDNARMARGAGLAFLIENLYDEVWPIN